MAVLNCKACGNQIKYKKGDTYVKCKRCGKEIFLKTEKIYDDPEKLLEKKRRKIMAFVALGLVAVLVFSFLVYLLVGAIRNAIINSRTEEMHQDWKTYTQEKLPDGYIIDGEYIYFGFYPQTIKEDDVKVGTRVDELGYYTGTDGEKYAKVSADPVVSGYSFTNGDDVRKGRTYYFKVEPIKWRILENDDGAAFIICENVIANYHYDDAENIYKPSEIKKWLTTTFYNTAFSMIEQSLILEHEEGFGKVFLLSLEEVKEVDYGFNVLENFKDPLRFKPTTDYTRATGAYMSTEKTTYGNGCWWLRVPKYGYDNYIRYVFVDGYISSSYDYNDAENGVVPALRLNIAQ